MTITEKIIAYHSNKKKVEPDDFVECNVSLALSNDITTPIAIKQFLSIANKVWNRNRVAIVLDHFTPNKDIQSAQQCKLIREFAKKQRIKYFFEGGNVGIEHVLLPENGMILPGEVIIGADSHTTTHGAVGAFSAGVGSTDLAYVWATGKIWLRVPRSIKIVFNGKPEQYTTGKDLILHLIGLIGCSGANYRSLEFSGSTLAQIPMNDRFTICNMAAEAGAKNGIIEPDDITFSYIRNRGGGGKFKKFKSDKNSYYERVIEIDSTKIPPLVAIPHLPSNIKPVEDLRNIYIDQVVIGSCTNGWYQDLKRAAEILHGKKVKSRLIIIPATPKIYKDALKNGLIEIFIEAGAVISPPTCGPCLGGHMGILADGEKCAATTNRNFIGRMGSKNSEIYLVNPYVAAATAIKGKLSHPAEIKC